MKFNAYKENLKIRQRVALYSSVNICLAQTQIKEFREDPLVPIQSEQIHSAYD